MQCLACKDELFAEDGTCIICEFERQVELSNSFECAFCGEQFMLDSLTQVEVVSNSGHKLGEGNLVMICPFCVADREVETLLGEFLMPDYMLILYVEDQRTRPQLKHSIEEAIADLLYFEHRRSLFEGWKP